MLQRKKILYFLIKKSLNVIKKRYKALEIKIVLKRKLISKFLTIKKDSKIEIANKIIK